ncbi:zinc finger BED domain-containing protein 4-like [Anguilla anguilla]|uniref:zinc finger BED domain-containing protein 4-like n=1 Tax=Anguilla anguilla TaxID=7936 RepID=UPI0015A7AA3B|nr:zinc finger BED domain-containing protein 4-like [Anguilla anguilla]
MQGGVIKTTAMPERHTAENIVARLHDITKEFRIQRRIVACVHDSASNMMAAGRLCEWEDVSCFAYTLQLCVNAGFDQSGLKMTIAAASNLVHFFHRSTVASAVLKVIQKQFDAPNHALVQSCCTRWNSIYFMFECLAEQRWPVCAVLSNQDVMKKGDGRLLEIKDRDWQNVHAMVPILKPFQIATEAMSLKQNVSISSVYPIVHRLISNHLVTSESEAAPVSNFKEIVLWELHRGFKMNSDMPGNPLMIATALDPHNHLSFMAPALRNEVYGNVEDLIQTVTAVNSEDTKCNSPEKCQRNHPPASALSFLLGEQYGVGLLSQHGTI